MRPPGRPGPEDPTDEDRKTGRPGFPFRDGGPVGGQGGYLDHPIGHQFYIPSYISLYTHPCPTPSGLPLDTHSFGCLYTNAERLDRLMWTWTGETGQMGAGRTKQDCHMVLPYVYGLAVLTPPKPPIFVGQDGSPEF